MDECISEGILAEFFRESREEIVEMGIYEFDQELYDKVLRDDGEVIGIEKGKKIGRKEGMGIGIRICQEILEGKKDNEMIAKSSGCSVEEIKKIREQFGI